MTTEEPARHEKARAWRKSKGLTIADLAELTGFSVSVIADMERGSRRGQKPEHATIEETSWLRFGLACAAIDNGLDPLF